MTAVRARLQRLAKEGRGGARVVDYEGIQAASAERALEAEAFVWDRR